MEPGDEEWMRERAADDEWIRGERAAGAEPDEGWPDEGHWPAWPAASRGRGGVSGSVGFSWWLAAVVAMAAAAAGVAVALLVMGRR